ncbi:MAG: aerobic carbon-monoxide dehydrogenase large subunit [Alphaproteobacteria bacterium]|jgi:carbon-monoxide dehydrogenase large subunit|nr:aerobic carbon-monoxide dehydrogenase large subunit [Alphaproteobacteria bacterium]
MNRKRATNALVGSPVERLEDFRFLTGRGQYIDDLVFEHTLHAVIVRSPVAHGRIRAIEKKAALARPGVHAVITATDIDIGGCVPIIPLRQESAPEFKPFQQPVIAHDKVRYVGEPVGVILAETQAAAEDALDAVHVQIDPLPAVIDSAIAAKGDVLLFENAGSNVPLTLRGVRGDPGPVFKDAAYTRRERFHVQRHGAVPMEARGLLAVWNVEQGHLTVYGAAKVAFLNRRVLAALLGLPESAIRMVENDVGGGFGARGEFYPEDFLIPFAARLSGRPVKWVEDRREHLLATNHAREADCELEIACDRNGMILALRGHAWSNQGAYIRTNGPTAARNIAQVLTGPYRIPHVRIDVSLAVTNKTPAGTYRGPGRAEADFFRERLFDIAAKELRLDPIGFRRRNLVSENEMPYRLATVEPLNIASETDSGDYRSTLDRCLREIDWPSKATLQGKLIEGRYHGAAVGCYIEGGAAGPKEGARLVLEGDGKISVYVGSSSIGQGLETVCAQIAADALELPLDAINRVFHGSTDHVTEGYGAYSSRSVVMGGNAIVAAAEKLRQSMRAVAAQKFGCAANEIEMDSGMVFGPNREAIPLAAFAGMEAEASFASNKRTYSYGAHAAHVAVDPKTGQIDVLDYVAVEDVGRIINPLTLHGQAVGAIVQGLGGALLEHFVYDEDGQLLTGSFADYLLPTASDFPEIRVVALEERPSPTNPLGAKGAGEGGIIPVAGVIANAVAAALARFGVSPRELPLSPPRIWALIQERKAR